MENDLRDVIARAQANPASVSVAELERAQAAAEIIKQRHKHQEWEDNAPRWKRLWFKWTGERL